MVPCFPLLGLTPSGLFMGLSLTSYQLCIAFIIIIKFPYNARSDWLKQRALSEIRKRVDDIKLAFKFFLRNHNKSEKPHEVKKKSFDFGGNRTNDLWIKSTAGLPTKLGGRTEKVGDDFRW